MKCLFKKVFSIEGNIGAGKSTILSALEKAIPNCIVLPEPVFDWKNIGGDDLLKNFYTDPKRWTFTFELYSMFSKVKKLNAAILTDAEIIIMERSLYSDKAFHHISYFYNKLNGIETTLLDKFYDDYKQTYPILNGIIYIDTDPKICLDRIKARGRSEEQEITLEYLEKLEDEFLCTKYKAPMMMVNGNYDLKKQEEITQMIMKFILKSN